MFNVLTIDVEDWYQTNDFNHPIEQYKCFEDRIIQSTVIILELLDIYQTKATFFILGCVAQKHPELVRRIVSAGHEVASHGHWHRMVSTLTLEEFRKDLQYSKEVLQELTGVRVNFYRAPSWSISRETLWAFEILEEEGFICDSSLQPFSTPLSGIKNAPISPYYPIVQGKMLNVLEFPPTVLELGRLRIPFVGGLYLRVWPLSLIKIFLKQVNKTKAALLYTHPWEMDIGQPRLNVSLLLKFVHYYNLSTTQDKLEGLLKEFRFVPLGEFIKDKEFPSLII